MARAWDVPGPESTKAIWADQANIRGEKPHGGSGAAAKIASGMAHRPNRCDQREEASRAAGGNATVDQPKDLKALVPVLAGPGGGEK